MARRPRRIKPDTAYSEVQRTVDRQFLFKPDPVVRNIIGSSVGRAQREFPVKIFWLDFNINLTSIDKDLHFLIPYFTASASSKIFL